MSPKGNYSSKNLPITWQGQFDNYIITAIQESLDFDIEEDHASIEKDLNTSSLPHWKVPFNKKIIAQAINNYLDEVFN